MTTTISELLYPNKDPAAAIDEGLAKHKLAAGVAGVGTGIAGLLGMPIGNLALLAYGKYQPIQKAKRETREKPGAKRVVPILKHKIDSTVHPTVEVEVNGVRKPVVRLELKAELEIESVSVLVEDGKIVSLAPGAAKAALILKANNKQIGKAKMRPVQLGRLHEAEPVIDLTLLEKETVLEVR